MNRIASSSSLLQLFLVLTCIGVLSSAFGKESAKKIADWNSLSVWQETGDGDPPEAVLRFQNAKGAVLHKEELRSPITTGFIRTAFGRFLTAANYSGGESGCCQNLHIFFPLADKIGRVTVEATSYGAPIAVRDLNGDGIDEIRVDAAIGYGIILDLGSKERACETALTPGIHVGLSEIRMPQYLHLSRQKSAFLEEDVTLTKPLQKSLTTELTQAENRLAGLGRVLDAPSADLAAAFQVFRARAAVTGEKDAFARMRKLAFSVRHVCDGKTMNTSVVTILEKPAVRSALK